MEWGRLPALCVLRVSDFLYTRDVLSMSRVCCGYYYVLNERFWCKLLQSVWAETATEPTEAKRLCAQLSHNFSEVESSFASVARPLRVILAASGVAMESVNAKTAKGLRTHSELEMQMKTLYALAP